ncbi:MAG: three-Cys-motif partner protein TcmP [Desulfobacteraceae bacterium]|nr:three-Cys-motif partner protein TcmP [Desulfobacteraceae bacterium]
MKTSHSFGGPWTKDKLNRLDKYLSAYMKIFTTHPKARNLITYYIDAFAGTGYRAAKAGNEDQGLFDDTDAENFQKGSAVIAIETEPPFNHYIFIETKRRFIEELEALRKSHPDKSIRIVSEDSNQFLKRWCKGMDWSKNRAVAFLDPYGGQVEWETIESIAATKAIDLWLLFPLGQVVNRILTRKEPSPAWSKRLDLIFGTSEWRSEFYKKPVQQGLFGEELAPEKSTSLKAIEEFFIKRLKTVFEEVATPMPLRNSRNVPIFLLCFAAGNPRGAKTAVKIANDILLKEEE